jgi:chemotaxis protein methyltransferase CheR
MRIAGNMAAAVRTEIPRQVIVSLTELIRQSIGLYFPENRWPDLQRKIMMMGRDLNIGDAAATAQWLLELAQPRQREELLISYLTIGETFFFRDQEVWELLKQSIIPERMASKTGDRKLTLWSAACSSGEEPYTMAMTVSQIPDLTKWEVTILATDINRDFIAKAKKGDYGNWSFRNMSPWLVAKYFHKIDKNRYTISPGLKEAVTFLQLNLAGNSYPSLANRTMGVDIIFCRNVLMYFPPKLRQKVINRLAMALNENGWLLLAASETGFIEHPALTPEQEGEVHVFRKQERAAAKPVRTAIPARPLPPQNSAAPHPAVRHSPVIASFVHHPEPLRGDLVQPPPATAGTKNGEQPTGHDAMEQLHGAERLFQNGSYEEARLKLQKLLADATFPAESHYQTKALALLAKVYANEGNLAEARNLGEQAIAQDKLNPATYYFLASVCQEQGDHGESVRLLKQSLFLDHDFILAHFHLASLVPNRTEAKKHLKNTQALLTGRNAEEVLPGSDGLTAGRLLETVRAMLQRAGD